jgi:hypothetical protein
MGHSTLLNARLTRAFAVVVALCLLAYALVSVPFGGAVARASAGSAADLTTAFAPGQALLLARSEGHRVEITSDETDSSVTYANPDGTLTTEQSQGLVRVRQSDGSFAPIDLTLTPNADGTYSPATSVAPFTLSAGGSATVATLPEASGRSVGLGWLSRLPAPGTVRFFV